MACTQCGVERECGSLTPAADPGPLPALRCQLQTTFGGVDAPDAEKGNCFSAALASLLAVPLSTVPNFMTAGPGGEWYVAANEWLLARGLVLCCFECDPFGALPERAYRNAPLIASGMGPRGHRHSVLWLAGELLHDPHPSGAGLVGEPDVYDVLAVVDIDAAARFIACARSGRG